MSAVAHSEQTLTEQGKGITVEPVGSNSGGGSSRRRMLQMVGAAAAIPAISGLGAGSMLAPRRRDRRRPALERRSRRADEGSRGAGRRRATSARARVGQGRRTDDPVHPRLVAEPSLLGEAIREHARRRVPARRLRPPWSWHVRGAARARALHRRQALGRRRRGDHRPTRSRPAGARRLVLWPIRHLRLRACPRPGSNRGDQLRRGSGQARRGGLRHPDRPRIPRITSPTPSPTIYRRTSGRCAHSCEGSS